MYCDNCIHIYLYLEALILANPNKEKNCNSLQKIFIIFIKHENIWLSGTPLLNPYNDNCRYIKKTYIFKSSDPCKTKFLKQKMLFLFCKKFLYVTLIRCI